MATMEHWSTLQYLEAGAYIAIMLAVLGVPQMLSSYFDLRARRMERQENEANAERRHQELLAAQARRDEREEERRRQDDERRHQELMAILATVLSNGRGQGNSNGQSELIRNLQQTIDELRAENEQLRQQNGNGSSDQ